MSSSWRSMLSVSGWKAIHQVTSHFKNERKSAAAVYGDKALQQGQSYHPTPFTDSKRQIRLLKIHGATSEPSGAGGGPKIHCSVEQHNLGDDESAWPAYTAVSYTWGGGAAEFPILLNGETFLVRDNLHQLLKALRQRGCTDTWFWIDQICIDQSNISEKGDQVQMMGDIYGKASEVAVWLGVSADGSDVAFRLLQALELLFLETQRGVASGALTEARCHQERQRRVQDLAHDPGWKQLSVLLERPYWSRLWIFQEMYLAQKLRLLCGPDTHDLDLALAVPTRTAAPSRIYHDLNEHLTPKLTTQAQASGALRLLAQVEARRNPITITNTTTTTTTTVTLERMPLQQCLREHAGRACYDPRDKVYGLIACVEPTHFLEASYLSTVEEVFVVALDSLVVNARWDDAAHLAELRDLVVQLRKQMGLRKWSRKKLAEEVYASWSRTAAARAGFDLIKFVRERDGLKKVVGKTVGQERRMVELDAVIELLVNGGA